MENLNYLLLGALITILTNIIIDLIRSGSEVRSKRKNYKLITSQELILITKTLEKLKTVFEYRNYFEYSILNSLDKSLHYLDENKSQSILLKDNTLQESLLELISGVSKFVTSARGVQDFFYDQQRKIFEDKVNAKNIKAGKSLPTSIYADNKENEEIHQQKSTQLFIDLVELNRKLEILISNLK